MLKKGLTISLTTGNLRRCPKYVKMVTVVLDAAPNKFGLYLENLPEFGETLGLKRLPLDSFK